ncbi:hypothetical protein M1843_01215 [Isoptericola sp. 4D.3]|uniref:Secreted protein n=1 Tax=Isoptericola peretonis TaxID=2918523 RepID=A0ABT0IYQ6_9MICO|nr:hypothetical protein [Isoptericola sp. 4D.3]
MPWRSTPRALLGRVTALLSLATLGLSPLGSGAVGVIAETWGIAVFFGLSPVPPPPSTDHHDSAAGAGTGGEW